MGRVVVFGSLNMDLVINVPVLPEPGVTVMGDRLLMYPGGKGANQAVAAARLGADVTMVGRVGNDAFAERMLAELRGAGVNADAVVKDAEMPTGSALIIIDAHGHNQIAVAPAANHRVGREDLERLARTLDKNTLLLLQMEIPPAVVRDAIIIAEKIGATIVFNTAPSKDVTPDMLKNVDILVANKSEAAEVLGIAVVSMGAAKRAALKARQLGADTIIVTMGAEGAVLCYGDQVTEINPYHVNAVDTTGAGDAFVGALAAALSRGSDMATAVRAANAVGAAATLKQGAQSSLPTPADLKQVFGLDWN
ncbi:MAG TPA: ribokinase [Chloroflexota bacterium]|nr:ribokinase [Chloroflexota bacterium]